MAVKTFTTNEVLTASDTNTYLNNGGLVYITSTTFGGATALNIDSCFTSTYTHYLIQINVVPNASTTFYYYLRAAGVTNAASNTVTTGYYQTTGVATLNGDTQAATTFGKLGYGESTYGAAFNLWLWNPQTATTTFAHADGVANNFVSHYDFVHQTNTQYDGIRFTTAPGTPTLSGNVRIYGARIS
jgi:hypothetical protein